MMQESAVAHVEPENDSAKHVVHVLMQFALAVRYRKNVVIVALAVTSLLGALYYATATRYYSSKASMVLRIGTDTWQPGMAPQESWRQSTMLPTYMGLIKCDKVIEGAVKRLPRAACIDFGQAPPEQWPKLLRSNLSVTNANKTNIVEVSHRSRDPHAAVTVVNAVVDSYQEFMDLTYKGTAGEIREALTRQMNSVTVELDQKERELWQAREQMRDWGVDAESKVLHPLKQRVVDLSNQLTKCRMELLDLRSALVSIQLAVDRGEDLKQHVFALADIVDQEVLLQRLGLSAQDVDYRNRLMQSRIDFLAELAECQKHFGPVHPRILELETRIRQTEEALLGAEDELKQQAAKIQDSQLGPMLVEVIQQKLKVAEEFEAGLQSEYDRAQDRAVKLERQLAWLDKLEKESDRLSDDRDLLLKQIRDIKLQSEGQDVRAHVVDEPKVDLDPVSPKLVQTILIALVSGLGLGLGMVYVLDILDDRFRSLEEMQALLGVPVLAMVRELEMGDADGIGALQTYVAPNATESEAFRTLRTALSLADHDTHQIVISSPEPGDGKTTVLSNLAVAVAQSGKKTLLIDADLRRPGLTAVLGMRGVDGLSSVIRGEDDLVRMSAAHIRPSGLEGLDVLPSGPRPANPAELLGSCRFSELLAWAESVYDQVFIDSPPTLATSDTAVIGRLTNGVVLVVQPAKNRRRMVMRCVENLAVLNIPLLGIVVNRVGPDKGGYYGYGYGGYYGYEYAYKDGLDPEEAEGVPDLGRADSVDAIAPSPQSNDYLRRDEAHPSGGIVPRRVARLDGSSRSRE